MKEVLPNASRRTRLARTLLFGLIVSICGGLVLMAQHVQPQSDKLPAPVPGTPNFGSVTPKPEGAELKVPAGFAVSVFAEGLTSPRYMVYAPNGDLFVSSFAGSSITVLRDGKNVGTYAGRVPTPPPATPGPAPAPRGAGAAPRGGARGPVPATPLPVANAAAAVPCTNNPVPAGAVGINQPQGMAFHNGYFYVANTNSIVRYKYTAGDITAQGAPEKVVDLIGGGHGWRNVIFNAAGTKMYVSVGSSSNNDAGEDCRRAAILEFNPDGTGGRIFASGLRNPEGLAWQPGVNDVLWTSVNERDGYGDNLPPDYITSVKDGGFYGWPYSHTGQNYDPRYVGGMPDLVKKALVPDVLIEAHSAAVGLAFYTGTQFPQRFRNGAFVGLHGSWNSSVAHGYKVIFVPFTNGKPGPTEDFLTGFVVDAAAASKWGRPVGVTVARDGSLLVADDSGGKIWLVRYTGPSGR
jgi:glucose/arabinose dehydrogenase